jgi:carbonic anhydrase
MRLLEAIVAANHAAVAGRKASVNLAEHAGALPLAALTCIDPRLNKLLPGALGLDEERFIWLRNAGNIITSPQSSTVRSLTLAVYAKGAKEIAIIGHTDCRMAKLTMADLLTRLKQQGIERTAIGLPNLQEFFGLFSSETQNVIKGTGYVRQCPFIPPKLPVHGLLLNTTTGKVEWVVNGYDTLGQSALPAGLSLPELVSSHLPVNTPPLVAGELTELAGKIEPLVAKKWEQAMDKIEAKIAEHRKPVPPPLPGLRGANKPAIKKKDPGPYR